MTFMNPRVQGSRSLRVSEIEYRDVSLHDLTNPVHSMIIKYVFLIKFTASEICIQSQHIKRFESTKEFSSQTSNRLFLLISIRQTERLVISLILSIIFICVSSIKI